MSRYKERPYSRRHGNQKNWNHVEMNLFPNENGYNAATIDSEYAHFLDADYEKASPQDMLERHEYQLQRYRKLRFSNSKEFTPEWKRFGRNHESEI